MDARPIVVAVRVGGPAGVPAAVPMAAHVDVAPVQPQPDASYRLNHKKLHITMAALGVGEVPNEAVLAMAKRRGNLIEFSIGNEVHARPADPARPHHKHFYLRYEKPINHRDARYCTIFDMRGFNVGRVLHQKESLRT